MLFNSLLYLLFLATAGTVSWSLVRWQAYRFAFLLAASCLFYMAWNPLFIFLILGSTCWDFTVARLIESTPDEQKAKRRLLLLASVGMNLALLCYFKYLNFFVQSVAGALRLLHFDAHIALLDIVLPVGISFYTFQTMSYCIDVYRREIPAEKSLCALRFSAHFFRNWSRVRSCARTNSCRNCTARRR